MPGTLNQHLKSLCILKILNDETDENNHISVSRMIEILNNDYNISCERKSLYRHINSLIDCFGADIVYSAEEPRGYYLGSRQFEDTELRLLIDAVESSHFISSKKSRVLIEKISSLAGKQKAKELVRNSRMLGVRKTDNEAVYYVMDEILRAIDNKKRIEFLYFDYGPDKKKHYRNGGKEYIVSPYALVWDDEKYYLHAYHEKYDRISAFRVDMMEKARMSDLPRLKENEYCDYDPSQRLSFNQFSGERMIVEMVVDNSLSSVIIDRFGNKVSMRKNDEKSFIVRVNVEMSPAFLTWVFSLGDRIYISFPEKARLKMKDRLKSVMKNYGEN